MKTGYLKKVLLAAMLAVGVAGAATKAVPANDTELADRIGHEIRMYTRYTIWDNINVRVQDGHVELTGQVSQPFKKEDLGRIVKSVPGVASFTNGLDVLPLSPFDDRLRIQVARAVYGNPVLSRYALQAVGPIHIIVDNGRVTLEGVVNSEMEKQVAGMQASSAGLSFGPVVNNLRVENPKVKKG